MTSTEEKGTITEEMRNRLVDVLCDGRTLMDGLIDLARDPHADVAVLVDKINLIERLDDERDFLIKKLKRQSTEQWAQRPEDHRTTRSLVFEALDDLGGWPQEPRIISAYIWATHRIEIDNSRIAVLRRDEKRSSTQRKARVPVFLVPALNDHGEPIQGLVSRSDWTVARRVITDDNAHLLHTIDNLIRTQPLGTPERTPIDGIIEDLADEALGIEPLPLNATESEIYEWRRNVAELADREVRRVDDERHELVGEAVRRIVDLPPLDQLWGRGTTEDLGRLALDRASAKQLEEVLLERTDSSTPKQLGAGASTDKPGSAAPHRVRTRQRRKG